VVTQGGPSAFFRGIGPRALSNGINSAVFFAFFELLRNTFKQQAAAKAAAAALASSVGPSAAITRKRSIAGTKFVASRTLNANMPVLQPAA
jgi:hypothetical protein